MPAKGHRKPKAPLGDPTDPRGMAVLISAFLERLKVRGATDRTVATSEWHLGLFLLWCQERSIRRPVDVTRPILQGYQRHLFYYRGRGERALSFRSQQMRLVAVKGFFRWLAKEGFLGANPAADLDLPKTPKRLPRDFLTVAEAEQVLAQPDLRTSFGLRDRAILETLYATGVRRAELCRLSVYDVDLERGTLFVKEGKGRKDRVVPLGERACAWLAKYLSDVRPSLVVEPDEGTLFLTYLGLAFSPDCLSQLARAYIDASGVGKKGACHLFRHTAATLMLENGADVRFIQALLGHASLESTQLYTQVSITKLREIHAATHPGARLAPRAGVPGDAATSTQRPDDDTADPAEELLSSLAAEAEPEEGEGTP
ncbi:site-specific tyrosine recombinase XerC [Acidobacteria bacterium ACD]|nr:site-specific tyrosine recombinase XerC [Acidobacteria bacterium ACD]